MIDDNRIGISPNEKQMIIRIQKLEDLNWRLKQEIVNLQQDRLRLQQEVINEKTKYEELRRKMK